MRPGRQGLACRKEALEWSLPGGNIDPGETQLEAARRELQEETCLPLSDAQFLGHHVLQAAEHWVYRMAVPSSRVPQPSHETVECRWFLIQEVSQLQVKPSNLELLRREGFIAVKG
ncbi:8-oxo-dGTP diphosphatase [Pseudomonas sp. LAMO17WK12:I8]|uniref:MutT/nudix family protein n=1 Tax=Pseudomonas monteilii TaxID=76759 RepID=A0AAE6RCP4_9PSED|nr:NUDIX domain-containing protein [Pseudomonas monteilii]SNS66255.1 8-oxo-dGTP diphosphatase [Pseudomonas sp. LAMO17WK12:I8]SNY13055.1 8-oxo-dGTP diphosphatase [Pseudomonas sp. LAMO17WK12:I12]SNY14073.1 8-oxo-dGTP diphosphatase [Pseudomonas sp. LAMO17WK12:I7]SNY14310.1 8-oxo-dGTP diphosphatase [Pseudomonas sp. LAMO17WK12:I11]